MSWDFLLFLICFILQAALLGIIMYGLICLSDLENDFINPHDASATITKWVVPEYVIQGSMTALLILCGKWVTGGIQVVMAIYNCRTYLRGDHQVDATDVFQKLGFQKKLRIGKLVFYLATFVLIIYKIVAAAIDALTTEEDWKNFGARNFTDGDYMLVESAVHTLLSIEHREAAHRIVQEAAATF